MQLIYVNPKEIKYESTSIEDVIKLRKINCIFYSICLSHAAYFFWNNFTCNKCNMYIEEQENSFIDLESYNILLEKVKKPKPTRFNLKKESNNGKGRRRYKLKVISGHDCLE